jgi:Ala-tRNA(Pro) deacylase
VVCGINILKETKDPDNRIESKEYIKMELFEGRPENVEGRLPREVRTYDFLDGLDIKYKRTDHEAASTMEACNEIDKILDVVICKNLFLCNRQKTKYYLLMMPGDKKFKTKEMSAQINSARLSFADADDMLKYLDIEPGAVSIMGLMNDKENAVQLLVDEDVKKSEYLGCHPCVCTSSLKMKTEDVFDKFLPAVGHEPEIVHLVGED